jgi:hypothetical protein
MKTNLCQEDLKIFCFNYKPKRAFAFTDFFIRPAATDLIQIVFLTRREYRGQGKTGL